MSIGRVVEAKAQDGTMTLGELRAFTAELDLKSLKATAVRLGDPVPESERRCPST